MIKVKLSKRMQMVAQTVTNGYRVADIGCDHAYTSIYMIQENIASHVIAMDINKGPLKKAEENIFLFECEDFIETRLSDGASLLNEGEVDAIVIAGMGGRLTTKILSDSKDIVKKCDELILQPQSEIHIVRRYLTDIGFYIIEEKMLQESGKYYVIIKASKKGCQDKKPYTEVEDMYGRYLLETKNDVLKKYLENELEICDCIIKKLEEYKGDNDNNKLLRKKEILVKKKNIREGLAYYEM